MRVDLAALVSYRLTDSATYSVFECVCVCIASSSFNRKSKIALCGVWRWGKEKSQKVGALSVSADEQATVLWV